MSDARFPALTAQALDGTTFATPDAFARARSVAVIGFGLDQRSEIESWAAELEALARAGIIARLFPAIDGNNAFMRGMVTAALKAALPHRELRSATIPLFTDVGALCASLGIADRDHVAVFVLDETGVVLWRATGGADAALSAALRTALNA